MRIIYATHISESEFSNSDTEPGWAIFNFIQIPRNFQYVQRVPESSQVFHADTGGVFPPPPAKVGLYLFFLIL